MKKLTFEIPEKRQVEINGHVFDILKADTDILIKAEEFYTKYANLDKMVATDAGTMKKIVAGIKDVIAFIDEMLGAGAVKKITAGKPLGFKRAIELMTLVCKAVAEAYNDSVEEKYGNDDGDEAAGAGTGAAVAGDGE